MAEYIEREAVLLRLEKVLVTDDFFGLAMCCGIDHAIDCIKEAPAADVAEVVRCKDCANYSDFDPYAGKRFNFHFCRKFHNITLESDFCSYGEKKNGKEQDK